MSNPTLIAKLGLDAAEFSKGLKASESSLKTLENEAKTTAAAIAFLEREMVGGGTAVQIKQHGELQSALRKTQAEAKAAARQLAAIDAINPDGAGSGIQLAGNKRVRRGALGIEGALLNAGSDPFNAATGAIGGAAMSLQMGLGPMLGVGVGLGLAKNLHDAAAASAELVKNAKAAMTGGGLFGDGARSTESLQNQIVALNDSWQALFKDADKKESILSRIFSGGRNFYRKITGQEKSFEGDRDDTMAANDAERVRLSGELARRKEEELRIERQAHQEGESSVAVAREHLRLKQEQAAVEEMVAKGLDPEAGRHILAVLQEESQMRRQNLALVLEQKRVESDARQASIEHRAGGRDDAVTKAQDAWAKAHAALLLTKEGTPERRKAQTDMDEAELDVEDARTQQSESNAQRARAKALAEMTASKAAKERKKLEGDHDDLQAQLDPGSSTYERSDEKRKDLAAQLAQNGADLRALDESDAQREFQRRKNAISANSRLGPDGQLKAIDERLKVNADEQTHNAAHANDEDVASRLNAEAADLKRKKDEILFTEKESLATLERQNAAITEQGYTLDAEARKRQIDEKYQKQIDEANRNGDQAKAAALENNRQAEDFNADVDEELLTPSQRAERQRHNDARGRAASRVASRAERQKQNRLDNSPDAAFDARFHVPNRVDDIKTGAENAGRGDAVAVDNAGIIGAINNPAWAKDLSFKNRT